MAEPTKKSPELENALSRMIGVDRRTAIFADLCVTCDGPAGTFRDSLSVKEYAISGMCQVCQDATFGGPDA